MMMGAANGSRLTGTCGLSLILAFVFSSTAFCAYWDAYTIEATKVRRGPKIDGVLDDVCWRKTGALTRFSGTIENVPAKVQTKAYLVYDDEALYVAFDCEEPDPSGVKTESKTTDDVWSKVDDIVAVFLVPEKGERYQFAVTAAGVKFDKYTGPKKDLKYEYAKDCTVATKTGEAHWVCEMKLPFKALRIEPQMGRTWRINLTRVRTQDKLPASSWAETSGQWKNENSYGYLEGLIVGERYLVKRPPVRLVNLGWDGFRVGKNTASVKLKSRKSSGRYRMKVTAQSPAGEKTEESQVIELRERGTSEHIVSYRLATESGAHRIVLSLGDAENNEVFYQSPPSTVMIPSFLHAFADRNYYTREENCRIVVRVADVMESTLADKRIRVALRDASGRTILETEKKDLAMQDALPLRLSGIPVGIYTAEGRLMARDDKVLSSFSFALEKHPPVANEVKLDRERKIFLVNGKPFMPLAWNPLSAVDYEAAFRGVGALGFNTAYFWEDGASVGRIRDVLDLAQKYGVKVHLGWRCFDFTAGKYRKLEKEIGGGFECAEHVDEIFAKIDEVIPQIKDHPALFGYVMKDEPGNTKQNRKVLRRTRETIRKHDPYHPTWVSFCRTVQILPTASYNEFYDFCGAHLYYASIRDGFGAINKIAWWMDNAEFATRDMHTPFFMTTQAAMSSMSVVERTSSEIRLQVYLGLTHGLTGGIGYAVFGKSLGTPAHGRNWQELAKLNKELEVLFPVIAEPEPEQEVLIPSGSSLHALLKVHKGKVYLLTANSNVASQEVQFRGNFIGKGTKVRELFKGDKFHPTDGGFSDSLRYYDTRVYEISGWQLAEGKRLNLQLSARKLPEKRTFQKVKEFFASESGAFYVAGLKQLCVYGPGNTLESVARDIGCEKVFTYDKKTKQATTSADMIRICYGGELIIGDENDSSKGETLEFKKWPSGYSYSGFRDGICCNGLLRVHHSRVIGNGRPAITGQYIGKVEIADSEIAGFSHFRIGKDSRTGRRTIEGYPFAEATLKTCTLNPQISEDDRVTVTYCGVAANGGKRHSKNLKYLIDWCVDDSKAN